MNKCKKTSNKCIFCQIVKKQIPSLIIAKNSKAIALLDINPVSDGHTIIIPKKHYCDWQNTPPKVLSAIVKLSNKVIKILNRCLPIKPLGYNYVSNQGKIAGQQVFHFHLHIMPKYKENEGFKLNHGKIKVMKIEKVYKCLVVHDKKN